MTTTTFWQIQQTTNQAAAADPETQQELIGKALKKLSAEEIIEYDNIFRAYINKAYDWKLWAAAYIVNGGCSDDCFMDFRGWLIAQGEEIYTKALEDPDSLADLDHLEADMDWEGFGYVAFKAYEKLTGAEMPINKALAHPDTPTGEEWDEDELDGLLLRLSEKHRAD